MNITCIDITVITVFFVWSPCLLSVAACSQRSLGNLHETEGEAELQHTAARKLQPDASAGAAVQGAAEGDGHRDARLPALRANESEQHVVRYYHSLHSTLLIFNA